MKTYTQDRNTLQDPDTLQFIPMDINNRDYSRVQDEISKGEAQIVQVP